MRIKTALVTAAFQQVKWGLDKTKPAVFCKADILVYGCMGWTKSQGKKTKQQRTIFLFAIPFVVTYHNIMNRIMTWLNVTASYEGLAQSILTVWRNCCNVSRQKTLKCISEQLILAQFDKLQNIMAGNMKKMPSGSQSLTRSMSFFFLYLIFNKKKRL